ncbi:MAG: hypothetical protein R6V85_07695 [Polyangia bacterium]
MTDELDGPIDLPRLAEVFDALRKGRHICMTGDAGLYSVLRDHSEEFRALFVQLGFELVHHPRDFFYFSNRKNFTELSARMAVFVFILVEHLADRGEAIEETLMTRRFRFAELPHMTKERYRRLMREAGVTEDGDIEQTVVNMERFGFAERRADDSFVFRPPAYRFLDLCYEMAGGIPDRGDVRRGDAGGENQQI